MVQFPLERSRHMASSFDHKLAMANRCSHEGVVAGAKAAVVATIATAIPTVIKNGKCKDAAIWARANLNHTAQALIISTVAGAAYFIVADQTILASARRNSFQQPAAPSLTTSTDQHA